MELRIRGHGRREDRRPVTGIEGLRQSPVRRASRRGPISRQERAFCLREHFNIDTSEPTLTIHLLTASADIAVEVEIRDGRASAISTTMDGYLQYLYRLGIEPMIIDGVAMWRVGEYAVIDVRTLESVHPQVDFTRRDRGRHLDVVNSILEGFAQRQRSQSTVGMLFDDRATGLGSHRVFPRFYSPDLAAARTPWEFQCGTGSSAVVALLAYTGQLPFTTGRGEVVLEWGNQRVTPDPYGTRTSRLQLEVDGTRVLKAAFSHSVVEILAEGRLSLPGYGPAQ